MFQMLEQQKGLSVAIVVFLFFSILCQFLAGGIYRYLIQETENMSATKNRALKQCKLKFVNCYQLNGKVANISVFVDKFLSSLKIGHLPINMLLHMAGQLLMLSVLCSGISIFRAIVSGAILLQIIPYYLITIFSLYLYFSIAGLVDIPEKKRLLKINLMDYLENHQISRLEFNKAKEDEWKKEHVITQKLPLEEVYLEDKILFSDEDLEGLLQELFYTSVP